MRDLGGLQVADLADHDHVRVLAQEAAQRGGEGHAALDVHLHLVDARHADFDRVLDRGDVALLVLRMFSAVYSDTVLPEPVGPVTSTMP